MALKFFWNRTENFQCDNFPFLIYLKCRRISAIASPPVLSMARKYDTVSPQVNSKPFILLRNSKYSQTDLKFVEMQEKYDEKRRAES